MKLYPHQVKALEKTQGKNKVAYFLDMGLGKTFVGSEKMTELNSNINLVICQKSKVSDWVEHFKTYYKYTVWDLTNKKEFDFFRGDVKFDLRTIGVINYDLVWRRPELTNLRNFTLMLDESSLIQNDKTKRTKFIMSLPAKNIILLSGTPTGGKYENLYSQLKLLGWNISKTMYWNTYIDYTINRRVGFPLKVIKGYKNVERLKNKMREYGCVFMKSDDVLTLPSQIEQMIKINTTSEYRKFKKDRIVNVNDIELIGDTTLTKLLYMRQLCGAYNKDKLEAFKDLINSTGDRVIVFYNFNIELEALKNIADELDRPISVVNGQVKDLTSYEYCDDSITFIQYQAGAMGLNLQLSNKIVYFTPPLSSEIFEQSKKRTHRLGQSQTCFYYYLTCKNSIEVNIYNTLKMRRDYNNKLFEEELTD